MKRIIKLLFLLVVVFFTGCSSVRNLNDYDSVTYEKKDNSGNEILGSVKVATIGFTWSSCKPNDNKAIRLMKRLEQKALRKYGPNIDIIDLEIGGMNGPITTALWAGGGAGILGSAVLGASFTERVVNGKEEETKIKDPAGYGASMGLMVGSACLFLVKGIEAKAVVVKSDTPYKQGSYRLASESEIREKQINYYYKKNEIERENRATEKKARQEKNQGLLNNLRTQLIVRGKDAGSPIVILDKSITNINSADGVSCFVEFINTSDKLVKYVNFDLIPYNRVFDQAYCHIDGKSEKTVNVTNFIGPNETYTAAWENVWYNSTILTMTISKVEVIYADNTKFVVEDPSILKAIEFTSEEQTQYRNLK